MKKLLLIQTVLLWLAIVAEQVRPDLLPAYALLLPVCSLILVVRASSVNVLTVGAALIVQDLVQMQSQPFVTVGVLIVGTFLMAAANRNRSRFRDHNVTEYSVSNWFLAAATVLCCGASIHLASIEYQRGLVIADACQFLIVAVSVFLVSAAFVRVGREFGPRYASP